MLLVIAVIREGCITPGKDMVVNLQEHVRILDNQQSCFGYCLWLRENKKLFSHSGKLKLLF